MSKHCSKCGEYKSFHDFHRRARELDGLNGICKVCINTRNRQYYTPEKNRARNLKKTYGITIELYDKMYNEQKGVCKICSKPESTVRQGILQSLAVDHCHTTGKIRGLLCNSCNRALGMFGDDTTILYNAVKYLERYDD